MEYGIINYERNNKKFVPDQNSSLSKRDDDTIKYCYEITSEQIKLTSLPLILKVGCV